MWLVTMLDQGFPNSAKEWADSLLWGEMRNFARGGFIRWWKSEEE